MSRAEARTKPPHPRHPAAPSVEEARSAVSKPRGSQDLLKAISATTFWLLIWQLIATLVGHQFLLASPIQVVQSLIRLLPTAQFWHAIATTAFRIIAGFLIGITFGSLLAYLANISEWAKALITGPMRVMRSVPVMSFAILILLWAGSSGLTMIIAALIVIPIAYANIGTGLTHTDPELEDVAKVYAATKWQRFTSVTWPAVIPYLAAAAQSGFGLAWKAGITAEVLGIPHGSIGERLYAARLTLATADVLAWTVAIVALSYLGERLLTKLFTEMDPE